MSILVSAATRVLVQGITGRAGTFYTDSAIQYGSRYVAGVRPGKGGATHVGLPVFDTVRAAIAATGADASLLLVPPHRAAAAMIEAIEAGLPLVVCVTERVPVRDMLRVKAALRGSATELVGPNSQGVLAPGQCKIGVMSTVDARPGRIGVVSRSASLTSEIVAGLGAAGLGPSTTIGVGGDPVHGIGFRACLERFAADPDTDGVVLVGEPGGREEEEAAEWLAGAGAKKPVVALVVGRNAPRERRMGHAGTLELLAAGSVGDKVRQLAAAGAAIASDTDSVAAEMIRALQRR